LQCGNKRPVPFCNALPVNLPLFDIYLCMKIGGFGARVWGLAEVVGLFERLA